MLGFGIITLHHQILPFILPFEFTFHELDNIILSPHRASYSDSGFPHLDDAIENLNRSGNGSSTEKYYLFKQYILK